MKYEVLRGQAKVGSYEFEELKALYQSGVLLPTDFFWIPGMPDWKPLSSLLAPKPSQAASSSIPPSLPSSAQAPAAAKSRSFAYSAWMLAAFFAPYLFSWRIIFDKSLGYSKGWKIFYALWIPIVLVITSGGGRNGSSQPENQESKNAAFMARLTPEQRTAVETMQNGLKTALRDNFNVRDADNDGKLNRAEFLSTGLFKHSYQDSDFDRLDANKDGYVTFEEERQR